MTLENINEAFDNVLTNVIVNISEIEEVPLLIKKLKANNFILGDTDLYKGYGNIVFAITIYGKIYNGMIIKYIDGYITIRYYDNDHKTLFKRLYLDKIHRIYVKKMNNKSSLDAVKLLASLDGLDD